MGIKHYIFAIAVAICFNFITAQRACTLDDFAGTYTQCVRNQRNLIWYLKQGVDCTGGEVPTNKFNLPCDIACSEGWYLPLGDTVCAPCQKGSFSIGGGRRVTEWNENAAEEIIPLRTYCLNERNQEMNVSSCSGWAPDVSGLFISSGNITDNQQSVLEVSALLLTNGYIGFEYRVSSEPNYDFLYFYVNNVLILSDSNMASFVTYHRNLTKGYYTFKWVYSKDFSFSQGEDAGFLRMLELGGIDYAESECTLCAKGTYTDQEASPECLPCPANTFANNTGVQQCTPCALTEYSFAGSIECTTRAACTANDYHYEYTACSNNMRNKYYVWNTPIICDTTTYPLPATQFNIACADCNPGTERSTNDWQCHDCSTGYFRAAGGSSCQPCASGSAAPKGYNFVLWEYWPSEWKLDAMGTVEPTDGDY